MSEIRIPDAAADTMTRIRNARVYDLDESIAASKFPMMTRDDQYDDHLTATAVRLAKAAPGTGHDNWLQGVRVAFDIRMTAKCLIELERYHFADIVSCSSTMHRIAKVDMNDAFNAFVDQRSIAVVNELVCAYNSDPTSYNYLKLLYSTPTGFTYRLRVTTNYRQLKVIYSQRRKHRLPEWQEVCDWIERLPHAELITGGDDDV